MTCYSRALVWAKEMVLNPFLHYRDADLIPSPIHQGWILEGEPKARSFLVSLSQDRTTSVYVWDCTAGRFNWFYGVDETVCVLEGSALITLPHKQVKRLEPGVIVLFPKGSQAEWRVDSYIRKVAFCRTPLPAAAALGFRAVNKAIRILSGGQKT